MLTAAESSHRREEAAFLTEQGRLADAERELASLVEELADAQALYMRKELCSALIDHAGVLRRLNRFEDALPVLQRAEALAAELPPLLRQGNLVAVLQGELTVYSTRHSPLFDVAAADERLRRLRALDGAPNAWVLDLIETDFAAERREWAKVVSLGSRAIARLDEEQWRSGAAAMRRTVAEALLESGELARAEPLLLEALAHARAKGPPRLLAGAEMLLARLRSRQGRHEEAWEHAEAALDQVDSMIRAFRVLSAQQRFVIDKLAYYAHAFALARSGGESDAWLWRAWSVAERAKSFYLSQLVASADVTLFAGLPPAVLGRLRELEDALDALESRPEGAGASAGDEARAAKLQALYLERQQLTDSIMAQNPRWAAVRPPAKLSLEEAFRPLQAAPRRWVPVSFYWEERPGPPPSADLHIFFSTGAGAIGHEVTHWSAADRRRLQTAGRALTGRVSPAASFCPDDLVEKILPEKLRVALSAAAGAILISPHLELQGLPLHALDAGGGSLVDHCPVQYVPTFALLPLRREKAPAAEIGLIGSVENGFGDRRLDGVEAEISGIADVWSRRRPGAVRAKIVPGQGRLAESGVPVSDWSRFEYLHIACHGSFPEGRPFDASLRLGREAVRAAELFGARLNSRLVSLSACSLGRRENAAGESAMRADEWIGIYLPLFYAGASVLLASLWDAESHAATKLMVALHEKLASGSAGPAGALREALGAVADRPAAHWANWIVVGVPSDQRP